MRILNRVLTLTEIPANRTVRCLAGCLVELNGLETASLLNPFHPGFRLSCVLVGNDLGPADATLVNYGDKFFNNIGQILGLNQTFEQIIARTVLDEDINGVDEILAEYTLTDLSNGRGVIRRSNQVLRNFG